jgi:aspartyl-tRNA(Asn)/glutamyl-tRNA(Gln) amidotransferase subunit B
MVLQGCLGPVTLAQGFVRKRQIVAAWPCSSAGRFFSSKVSGWKVDPASGIISQGKDQKFQTIIGLEIHAQLDIPTKLFSRAPTSSWMAPPNSAIDLIDVGVPGSLPVLSKQALHSALLAAGALECDVPTISRFERKHYAYADLPLGYQITQQRWPLARNGRLLATYKVDGSKSKQRTALVDCRIDRIQLEQDTGKTTSTLEPDGSVISRVDLNRAGSALIEIVSAPDLRSPRQAVAFMETLRQLLQHLGVCDGKMEHGSLRCDLNVNVQSLNSPQHKSPRVEVKNLNSIKHVHDAAVYEAIRQASTFATLADSGSSILVGGAETRTWNVVERATTLLRRKDDAQDYRFMPDPDLPPIVIDNSSLNGISLEQFWNKNLPELPAVAFHRLQNDYGLSSYQASVIVADPPAIEFLDVAIRTAMVHAMETSTSPVASKAVASTAANILSNELFGILKESGGDEPLSIKHSLVSAEQLGELVAMLHAEKISTTMAKKMMAALCTETSSFGKSPQELASECGFELITSVDALKVICECVVKAYPEELTVYHKGNKFEAKIFKLFIGKAMSASKGNAHPERLREILKDVLDATKGRAGP